MKKDGAVLSDQEKCTHLLGCMVGNAAKQTVCRYATMTNGYDDAIQALEDTYGGNWHIYPVHVAALTQPDHYIYTLESLRRRELIDVNVKGLESCEGDDLQTFLGAMFISRFDKSNFYEWNGHWEDEEALPTIRDVRDFFRKREVRMVEQPKTRQIQQLHKKNSKEAAAQPVAAIQSSADKNCPACTGAPHFLARCSQFVAMNVDQRQELVRRAGMCYNCLFPGHTASECKSKFACRVCKSRHHSMLHKDAGTPNKNIDNDNGRGVNVTYGATRGTPTIFSTAQVSVSSGRITQVARALLDSGSVPSLISEKLATTLKLPRTPCHRQFTCATGDLLDSNTQVVVGLRRSADDDSETVAVVCHVVKSLPTTVPPERPKEMLANPFLKRRNPIADKELGGKVDLLLRVADSGRCHRGPRHYTDDRSG